MYDPTIFREKQCDQSFEHRDYVRAHRIVESITLKGPLGIAGENKRPLPLPAVVDEFIVSEWHDFGGYWAGWFQGGLQAA